MEMITKWLYPAMLFFAAFLVPGPDAVAQSISRDARLMTKIIRDTSFEIVPGVQETDLTYLNKAGKPEAVYVLRANLHKGKLALEASTPFASDTFCRQTLMESIHWENGPHHHVIGGVNADFFDMSNGVPVLMEMTHGKVVKGASRANRPFMGVLKNGKVIIGDSALYVQKQKSLREALGGAQLLVKNGREIPQLQNAFSLTRHPRTAAGIVNSHTVLLVVVDGRQPDYSNGMPLDELAHLMKILGAKTALNLDGGGSSTLVSLNHAGDQWINRNRPSGKRERAVANGWIIVDHR